MATQAELDAVAALIAVQKIEEQNPSSATVDFQNIPATFKHLEIIAFLRGVGAANEEALRIRFNNDAVTLGNGSYGSVLNSTASNANDSAGAYVLLSNIPGGNANADKYAAVKITIPHYAGGDHKSVTSEFGYSFAASAASTRAGFGGGTWPITTAINRILLVTGTGGGTFAAGSIATLYGRL